MVTADDSALREPRVDSCESLKTSFCIFNGFHDYCTHDMSDLKKTAKV